MNRKAVLWGCVGFSIPEGSRGAQRNKASGSDQYKVTQYIVYGLHMEDLLKLPFGEEHSHSLPVTHK